MSGLCSVLKAPAQSLHPGWTLTSSGSVEKLRTPSQQPACSLAQEQTESGSSLERVLTFFSLCLETQRVLPESLFVFLDGRTGEPKPRGVQGQALGPPRWLSYSRMPQQGNWEGAGSGGQDCVSLKLLLFTHLKSFTEFPHPCFHPTVCVCVCVADQ